MKNASPTVVKRFSVQCGVEKKKFYIKFFCELHTSYSKLHYRQFTNDVKHLLEIVLHLLTEGFLIIDNEIQRN